MANSQATTATQAVAPPPANNQTETAGGLLGALTPITLMVVAFYFLMIRPQQKREAKMQELMSSLKRGDKVVTVAGIIGVVHKIVGEKELSLEVVDGTRLRMLKSSVTQVLERNSELGNADVDAEEKTAPAVSRAKSPVTVKTGKFGPRMKKAK
ncbi:MAG: preprotein translocase subunit YajC [Holosporaceae bacterium]|jgi:preprotein translocase subunit YajC|nr:preprotein translocase subunit YajC [Holosporaceae bacterium]